ncbi:MAG: hypothetical protein ACKN9T_13305 [Candidatus Methylumidiphilus sp.]
MSIPKAARANANIDVTSALLLGTGLAFASLILVPALAAQIGLSSSLTGALRIALMKASHRAIGKSTGGEEGEAEPVCASCH